MCNNLGNFCASVTRPKNSINSALIVNLVFVSILFPKITMYSSLFDIMHDMTENTEKGRKENN